MSNPHSLLGLLRVPPRRAPAPAGGADDEPGPQLHLVERGGVALGEPPEQDLRGQPPELVLGR